MRKSSLQENIVKSRQILMNEIQKKLTNELYLEKKLRKITEKL